MNEELGFDPNALYKVQLRIGWKNQLNGDENLLEPGSIISFEEGDFHPKALSSLEDTLRRGLVVPWDVSMAGRIEHMSRDEKIKFLLDTGKVQYKEIPNDAREEDLDPLVEAELALERGEEPDGSK